MSDTEIRTWQATIDADLAMAADAAAGWAEYQRVAHRMASWCRFCLCEECRCDDQNDGERYESEHDIQRAAWRDRGGE